MREATAAFGRGECFIEQFLDRPRHIEAQVIADTHGRVVVLGDRDCSLQRRNQKLVEEAPAPFLSDEQRVRIHQAARDICARAGYVGAGTVEFLLARDGRISFLEVNTRLQVEHPVTEETSGLDLVVEQLRVADGLPLSIESTPAPRGHSLEFRINAEDPGRGYLPTPGLVALFAPPSGPGVRIDSGVESGSRVPGVFDSLLAKLIVSGATREQALARARRALREFEIDGVASVLPFHRAVVDQADFIGQQGFGVHTRWIETEFSVDLADAPRPLAQDGVPLRRTFIEIDGRRVSLGLPADMLGAGAALAAGLATGGEVSDAGERSQDGAPQADRGAVTAPITGTLLSWQVQAGATVEEGQVLAVMEAMKMEAQVLAPIAGVLRQEVTAGAFVEADVPLGRIEGMRRP